MKKKFLAVMLFPLLASSLFGCQKKADINIGILQWVPIEALTRATNGFKKAVKAGLTGKSISFEVKNAYGESSSGSSILNSFVSKNKDLIMANATPAVTLAVNATDTIPIVGTSVTTYEGAFGGAIPRNVTGTSDLADLGKQAEMVFEWFPDAKKIGILYCSKESNSKYQSDTMKSELNKLKSGLNIEEITFSNTNDLSVQLNAKISSLDVLYIPTDNTCADNGETIRDICSLNLVPVIAGEAGICAKCGLATASIDYFHLGEITGEMAVEILKNHKKPSELAIRTDDVLTKYYNADILEDLGLTVSDVPEGYIPL